MIVHVVDIFVQRRSAERVKKASRKTGHPKAEASQSTGGTGSGTNRKTNSDLRKNLPDLLLGGRIRFFVNWAVEAQLHVTER
jgi:hypothetical protein